MLTMRRIRTVVLLAVAFGSHGFLAWTHPERGNDPAERARSIEFRRHEFKESPFGIHVFATSEEDLPVFAATGAKWVRTACLRKMTEPEKGKYVWDMCDRQIRGAELADAIPLTRLETQVVWAMSEKAKARNQNAASTNAPMGDWTFVELPADTERYARWVTACVERYDGDGVDDMPGLKGRHLYWQIENELTWRWIGTKEELVQLFRITSEAIRRAEPEAKIVMGGMTGVELLALADGYLGDQQYIFQGKAQSRDQVAADSRVLRFRELNEYLLEKGASYFDIVSFHKYGDYQFVPGCVAWLRDKMAAHGYSKPTISTEMGGPFINRYEAYTESSHADAVIKYHVVSLACGIEQIHWSTLFPTPQWGESFVNTSLVDIHKSKRPAYHTYTLLVLKLKGLRAAERMRLDDGDTGTRLYKFETGNGVVFIAWSERINGRHLEFDIGAPSAKLTDVFGTERIVATVDGKVTLDLISSPIFVEPIADTQSKSNS